MLNKCIFFFKLVVQQHGIIVGSPSVFAACGFKIVVRIDFRDNSLICKF